MTNSPPGGTLRGDGNYYHCFLGNGLDAVLIGPTGSMVADRVAVDRCYWYKSDRYYPEHKLAGVVNRFPADKPLEHAEGSGWYELAPLGRTWYQLYQDGRPLQLRESRQRFVPQEGTLYSDVDYGSVRGHVTTFVHAARSLLVENYEFDGPTEFVGWMAPGVWHEEGFDTDPFVGIRFPDGRPECHYDLGETRGLIALRLDPASNGSGSYERARWLNTRGRRVTKYFSIVDDRQSPVDTSALDQAVALGYDALRREHLDLWREYCAASSVCIPDQQFQRFYNASMYQFKASQNTVSGGLPVNNLRGAYSSHLFWDSYFIQRALLEANHRAEALEACRFFQRTLEHARRHARDEFGAEGLKWDWEITHDGRKAYGVYLHQKDQVHNNASYANEIWQYYEFTQDHTVLREFYPILEGLAHFFLGNVVESTPRGYETRAVIGISEEPVRVKNEGITVAGAIAILRHTADAARILGIASDLASRCDLVAEGLGETLTGLYNGAYFAAAEGSQDISLGSLAPFYPMRALPMDDPRCTQTVLACIARAAGKTNAPGGDLHTSPWVAGIIATILAAHGNGDAAWETIQATRPTICNHGGMSELVQDGHWNMQYFGTAQGAVCTAIHNLLLQARDEEIRLFPAVPRSWNLCSFDHLLAAGCEVSASCNREGTTVDASLRNASTLPLNRRLIYGETTQVISLAPGESRTVRLNS